MACTINLGKALATGSFPSSRRALSPNLAASVSLRRALRSPPAALRAASDDDRFTVLVADQLGDAGLGMLRDFVEVDYAVDLAPEELCARIGGCDALIVGSEMKVSRDVFGCSRGRLKVVGIAGGGIDNVNLAAANENRCLVVNAPSASATAVAEHAIALLTAMARNIAQAAVSVKSGNWQQKKYVGMSLSGKTLAVMGFVEVGFDVARRAKGLGMHVIAYDPYASGHLARAIGVELVTFDKAIANADFISLHMHLTPATQKMLNDETFAKMKKGVQILNVAHGGLIDEDALVRALDSGIVSRAAVDVLIEEPPPKDNKLVQHEKVIVTPNLGDSTFEAQEELAIEIAEAVIKALKGELPSTVVNEPMVAAEVLAELKPFLDLAINLGRFAVKLIAGRGGFKAVKVTYASAREPDQLDTKLLRAGVIKGLIEPISSVIVNWVNGDSVAKQRGLRISEERVTLTGSPEYPLEFIRVQIANVESRFDSALSTSGDIEVEGRVKDGLPFLTKVGNFEVDVRLEGCILLCRAIDQPGLIGKIGSILGEANVNIGFMKATRTTMNSENSECMISIKLDDQPTKETLKKIGEIAAIREFVFLIV
ncbi:D-3-phosphoglycerate dehydrogenase 3, chloroplastic-like [Syzygium oleosum]|uniref:D-3-phosphoglycerate dehydrogenase 3, chloroplastic-like n=1 Tax=Syzygium oleosum TaxID=219896 RepID=UPI0011D1F4EE|nr:D-3-phosphoglycerate dehydrogenase 3, chloroplastic-like [Syzygium oleosum]